MTEMVTARMASADPNASTDDRSVGVATKSSSYTGITATAVQADLTANKARLTQIEVNPTTTPETFTVVMVANTGAYKVARSWWYVDRTSAQLSSDLTANNGRLIDLTAYQATSGEQYAYVMVLNTKATARSWWYDVHASTTTI